MRYFFKTKKPDKVARICNRNPNNIDSWRDIAGYATLVVKELERKK